MLKLFEKIGQIFAGLFNSAKRLWKKASEPFKDALLKASSIVDIINRNVNALPPFVIEIILQKFPDLNLEKIKEIILTVSKDLHIAENTADTDLEVMLARLQEVLKTTKQESGKTWAKISHTAYLAIAVLLAPIGTKIAAIVSLAEYVYHDLIKGGK